MAKGKAKATKETVAERRARWAAQAARERAARRDPSSPERRAWLARPSVQAAHSAEWLREQLAACKAAAAAAKGKKSK